MPEEGWRPGRYRRVAMVARWKPVHLGHARVLEGLIARAEEVWIGIGSANRYDVHNPFTAGETRDMLEAVLDGPAGRQIVEVPDLGHGPRWREMVAGMVGPAGAFVTANAWVRELMSGRYPVVHPSAFVPPERRLALSGTMVRAALARGEAWEPLVPPAVARLIRERGLAERFRREFGLATLALQTAGPRIDAVAGPD